MSFCDRTVPLPLIENRLDNAQDPPFRTDDTPDPIPLVSRKKDMLLTKRGLGSLSSSSTKGLGSRSAHYPFPVPTVLWMSVKLKATPMAATVGTHLNSKSISRGANVYPVL